MHTNSRDDVDASSSADQSTSSRDEDDAVHTGKVVDGQNRTKAANMGNNEVDPVRWIQPSSIPVAETEAAIDERGQFIVSRVQWPTGDIAYTTPPAPDGKLAPRFGYNVVQVKKHVSWWKHYRQHPRISVAYINIQVLFLLGAAWLMAFLVDEYRRTVEQMRTPGAMVGEHRGRGPVGRDTQKIEFKKDEMSSLVGRAQDNWMDAREEAQYIGSKDYAMKKIPRPKEFSVDDLRKR
ncbi:hypothetical protein ERJ75_000065300 [Trypanosoma vivax]|nr:hypothetical protein ERJ75_000065300 [Trypanosoma vivax]